MLVLFGLGLCFFCKGILVLLWGVLDMNLLVLVGMVVVYGYFLVVIFVL